MECGKEITTCFVDAALTPAKLLQLQADTALRSQIAEILGGDLLRVWPLSVLGCQKQAETVVVALLFHTKAALPDVQKFRELEALLKTKLASSHLYPDVLHIYYTDDDGRMKEEKRRLAKLFAKQEPSPPVTPDQVTPDHVKSLLKRLQLAHLDSPSGSA